MAAQRCAVCGFTVRRFASHEGFLEGIRSGRRRGKRSPRLMRREGKIVDEGDFAEGHPRP